MEEEKKDDKSGEAESGGGACSRIMCQIHNLIGTHGVHVVALAAFAVIGFHLYNRYGKPSQ